MSILNRSFVASIILVLLVSGTCLTNNAVKAASVPTGIVYSIPIILTNTQFVATPAPFQQMITVNSATYSSLEASNLQNIEFYDSIGNIIPSWLESGNSASSTNTIYWLNIANGIPASSSITIYMGFNSPTINVFNDQNVGEAPTLSPIYGEYDNGAKVFAFYDNFAGSTLNSQWSLTSTGGSYSVNNGLTIDGVNGDWESIASNQQFNPQSQVFDSCAYFTTLVGFVSPYVGLGWNPPGTHYPQYLLSDTIANQYTLYNHNEVSGATTATLGGSTTSYQIWSLWADTSSSFLTLNYGATVLNSNGFEAMTSSRIGMAQQSVNGEDKVQWVRLRALPANGIMPTISINSQPQQTTPPTTIPSFSPTSTPHVTPPTSNSATTPMWAFNGAYVEYQTTYTYAGASATLNVKYSVSNIDSAANKMDLSISYSGYLSSQSIPSISTSISNPSLLPVISQSDLALLNSGQAPSGMSGAQVTTGVSINVPAGSFTTDRIEQAGGRTEWVDSNSGVIVQLSNAAGMEIMPAVPGISSPIQLAATNIPTTSGSSILIYVVLVVFLLGIVGVFIFLRKRKRSQLPPPPPPPPPSIENNPNFAIPVMIPKKEQNTPTKLASVNRSNKKTELRKEC